MDPRMGWPHISLASPFADDQRAVWARGERRFFTSQEWLILSMLRRHENSFVKTDAIEEWLYNDRRGEWPRSNTLAVCVCHIRKKLRGSGYVIRSLYGDGYMVERE